MSDDPRSGSGGGADADEFTSRGAGMLTKGPTEIDIQIDLGIKITFDDKQNPTASVRINGAQFPMVEGAGMRRAARQEDLDS